MEGRGLVGLGVRRGPTSRRPRRQEKMKTLERADKLTTEALNVMDEIQGKDPAAEVSSCYFVGQDRSFENCREPHSTNQPFAILAT